MEELTTDFFSGVQWLGTFSGVLNFEIIVDF
jgi:hypothetical protein